MDYAKQFLVTPGSKVRLVKHDPAFTGILNKADAQEILRQRTARLAQLQYLLYAEDKRAVLVVLQAMDAGGKDGVIRHVMAGINPQGCRVTPFKVPTPEELAHDFLWRVHKAAPPKGVIGVFNRSHYEDVLVVRVHNLVPETVWSKRYELINAFEKHLAENDVTILKFFLHISKEEQKERFLDRIKDPQRNWKVRQGDFDERRYWDDYMAAYEDALSKTSTEWAPWHVIPANRKWFRNVAVAEIIVDALERLDMKFPPGPENLHELVVE